MLMNEISHKFHPYIEHIKDVIKDGNCRLRLITLSLGHYRH